MDPDRPAPPAVNRQVVLRRRPDGRPGPDDFELVEAPVPVPGPGQVLVRQRWLSVDPAMRNWVAASPGRGTPVPLGGVMRCITLGEVVASDDGPYAVGDLVVGRQGWQDYALSDGSDITRRVDPGLRPRSAALGVLGHIGITASVGMLDIGAPQPGETVVVSSAAGAVGSLAGQLAAIAGARVVGIAGSPAKVALCVDTLGFDACVDYRAEPDVEAALRRHCPDGVDVYFDNVGGDVLDAVLRLTNPLARVAVCGTLSIPTGTTPTGPRLERVVLDRRLRVQGFVAGDHAARSEEVLDRLAGWLREGRLQALEDVTDGLEAAPVALARMLAGDNLGKTLVRVLPDDAPA